MDATQALRELGLGPGATWTEIKGAYRRRIRLVHPDIVGADAPSAAASQLTEAYGVLRHAHAAPRTAPTGSSRPRRTDRSNAAAGRASDGTPDDHRTGIAVRHELDLGAADTFGFFLEAAHRIGAVSHVDPDEGIVQVLLEPDGGPRCQLLVTIDRGSNPEQVAFTLDSLTNEDAPPIDEVVEALLGAPLGPGSPGGGIR
jgi:hypothetical protein